MPVWGKLAGRELSWKWRKHARWAWTSGGCRGVLAAPSRGWWRCVETISLGMWVTVWRLGFSGDLDVSGCEWVSIVLEFCFPFVIFTTYLYLL